MKEYHPQEFTDTPPLGREPADDAWVEQFFTAAASELTPLTVNFDSALDAQPQFLETAPLSESTSEGTIHIDADTLHLESGKEIPGISYFFRNGHDNNAILARHIAPQLMREQPGRQELDLLEIGCYTGRDTASLAASLSTYGVQARIHAIDVNRLGLEQAVQPYDVTLDELRAALEHWQLPEDTLNFFESADEGRLQLIQPLRDRLTFSKLDIRFAAPAQAAYDVVVANKVIGYYGSEAPHMLDNIIHNIHTSLRPGGLFTFDDNYIRAFELTDERLLQHGFVAAENRYGVPDWERVSFFTKIA